MSHPIVYPYQNTQVFTDGGQSQGDWQLKAMDPVLSATETTNQGKLGVVDGEGRVVSLYASTARTVTPTASPIYTRGAQGVSVYVSATAVTSSPSVVVTIDGYDPSSNTWYNLLTSAAIATVSTKRMVIFPNIAVVANLTASSVLPDTIRVVFTHGNTDSITYSVDLDWMP